MRSLKTTLLVLIMIALMQGCGNREEISDEMTPVIQNGIIRSAMNNLAGEYRFSGNWSGPMLAKKAKRFYRIIQHPGAGFQFYAPIKEAYTLQLKTRPKQEPYELKISHKIYKVEKRDQVLTLNKVEIQQGLNTLEFIPSPGGQIALEEIKIAPRRLTRTMKGKKPGKQLFTPARLTYYLDPETHESLKLEFAPGKLEELTAKIEIQSQLGRKELTQKITSKSFEILPIDNSLQEIRVHIPGKGNSHVVLNKSLAPKVKQDPKIKITPVQTKNVKNVLIILLDAARADRFGAYGYKRPTTPNIDRLAKESIVFEDCISEAAYTLASTGTLLTGLPPDFHNVISAFRNRLDKSIITLPELFRAKGFFTGAISSNPYLGKAYNYHKGFDHFQELFKEQKSVMAETFIEPFDKLLDKAGDKPFFIYLHLREPHIEYLMPPPFLGRFQEKYTQQSRDLQNEANRIFHHGTGDTAELELLSALYDENLLYGDHVVGQLLELLKKKGLFDNTMKVILSDHGEGMGEHGMVGHNVVLYDEGIHIPLIMHIPGYSGKAASQKRPALTSDLTMTLAELFHLDYPYKEFSQGKNLFHLPGKRLRISRTMRVKHYAGYRVDFKPYSLYFSPPKGPGALKLFHLGKDPGAKNPLAGQEMIQRMMLYKLDRFLENSSRPHFSREAVKLDKKDLESLRALGYLD